MRIDSSNVGMESGRTSSFTTIRMSKFTITSGRASLRDAGNMLKGNLYGNLLGTDAGEEQAQSKEKGEMKNPREAMADALEEMRAKVNKFRTGEIQRADLDETGKQLRDIRQQCMDFLMMIFFPGRRSSFMMQEDTQSQSLSNTSTASSLASAFGVGVKTYTYSNQIYHAETENTAFSTQGTVRCKDGREINFNLNLEMSRSFEEYYEENFSMSQVSMCDPLVINLDGNIAELSDQTFFFDIDGDGKKDEISRLSAGSGYLALDRNGDGVINDGTELFGTQSGNGFADLAAYDTDKDGFIDEDDEIWSKLKIWVMDENGEPHLYSLAEKGVGAIGLQNSATDFTLTGAENQTNGMIRRTGIFLYENGNVGTVQHVDLALHDMAV